MTQPTVRLDTQLPTLSTAAMEAFCQDLDGMLGIAMTSAQSVSAAGPLEEIKPLFAKCAVVYSVQAQGTLHGRFSLIIDRPGLFLLSGLIVMLPEDKIKQECKQGTLDSARKLADTLKEIGNLLVGSWDRLFREQLAGHKHLFQSDTHIVDPWNNTQQIFGLDPQNPCLRIVWEVTAAEHPPFKCAAVFPAAMVDPSASASQTPAETEQTPPLPKPQEEKAAQPAPDQSPKPDLTPASAQSNPPQPPTTESAPQTERPVSKAIEQLIHSVPTTDSTRNLQILNQPARSVMNRPLWLSPNDSVETALQRMQQQNTRYALVEEQDQLTGILSRGDLNSAVSPYLKPVFESYRRPLDDASLQIRIKWFMSRPVQIADPDTPLWKIMETMCRYDIRALPIQDAGGAVLGLVTALDIFRALIQSGTNQPDPIGPVSSNESAETLQPAQEEK